MKKLIFNIYWSHRLLIRTLYKKRGKKLHNADENLSVIIAGIILIFIVTILIPKKWVTFYFHNKVTPTASLFSLVILFLFPVLMYFAKWFYFNPSKVSRIRSLKIKNESWTNKRNAIMYVLFWIFLFFGSVIYLASFL